MPIRFRQAHTIGGIKSRTWPPQAPYVAVGCVKRIGTVWTRHEEYIYMRSILIANELRNNKENEDWRMD